MELSKEEIKKYCESVKELLHTNEKYKFDRINNWSNSLQESAGIYAIFIGDELKYIGETANFKLRMKEVHRTYNHSFRKKLGKKLEGKLLKNKFDNDMEEKLDTIFHNEVSISFVPVSFGRLEIETLLVTEFQDDKNYSILNSVKKRK